MSKELSQGLGRRRLGRRPYTAQQGPDGGLRISQLAPQSIAARSGKRPRDTFPGRLAFDPAEDHRQVAPESLRADHEPPDTVGQQHRKGAAASAATVSVRAEKPPPSHHPTLPGLGVSAQKPVTVHKANLPAARARNELQPPRVLMQLRLGANVFLALRGTHNGFVLVDGALCVFFWGEENFRHPAQYLHGRVVTVSVPKDDGPNSATKAGSLRPEGGFQQLRRGHQQHLRAAMYRQLGVRHWRGLYQSAGLRPGLLARGLSRLLGRRCGLRRLRRRQLHFLVLPLDRIVASPPVKPDSACKDSDRLKSRFLPTGAWPWTIFRDNP